MVVLGGAGTILAYLKFRHKQPLETQKAIGDSFERQADFAKRRAESENENEKRVLKDAEVQEEAWRAQQRVRSKVPRTIDPGKPVLTGKEAEAMRGLLKAARPLLMTKASDYILRGNAHYSLGEYAAALDAYNSSIELDPGRAVTHINRSSALLRLDRIPEALAASDRALQLGSHDSMAQYNKARALSRLRKGTKALSSLELVFESQAQFSQGAKTDSDLAYLRDHPEYGPRFWELVEKVEEEREDEDKDEGSKDSESSGEKEKKH